MSAIIQNKRKIINDPVYGFVSIHSDLIFDIIEHSYFQRLRRIKQLGLTHLVYPGALHTRFHHSIGAMHLMRKALNELRFKGTNISDEEYLAANIAILLHDIGHGPYSHALEHSIVTGISHEQISEVFLKSYNEMFDGKLEKAIAIFNGSYHKKYLHELVSSQFDMDRLDYLKRDSFFSGVSEGVINYERLLNMINVVDDQVVIEAKGIYSVEKFITARRLMYWQVYLHKTVLAAELMIMKVLERAKQLRMGGVNLFASPSLDYFLNREASLDDFYNDGITLRMFSNLDDYDIFSALKVWVNHDDKVLSVLSNGLVN
ncbi:MAG: phosphohydrolase, partial [Marinilabiliales bacterium]